ncbi:hypothetical protein HanRHA438_Chr08g0328151 [Helianthus annuus]|nr:hypothetical protein HanRHA438_Chr08g0328151 [Helianthus annuus]
METCTVARIDAQDIQIKQLQSDVTEIKSTLKLLEEERAESAEFRKIMLNWMTQHEKKGEEESLGSSFRFGSVLAQLETIVSRSDERLSGCRQLMSTGHTDSRSLGDDSKLPTPGTPLASVRSKSDKIPINTSQSDVFGAVNIRSISSYYGSSSPVAQLTVLISGSEDKSSGPGSLMSTRANWAIYDIVHWKLGSEPVMGHDVGLKTVVDLDFADLGRGVGQKMVVGLIFSVLKLHEKGKAPFDRGNDSLSHRLFNGMGLTFSVMWHFWVVHGQPRPPEDSSEEAFTGFLGHALDQSLEDKTFFEGGVLIEILF